ncbi:MAG TPA: hypothetical protein PK323_02935 [Bacteroidia bacterium]|nr:hypothetical protein [Bacteroidia bacterium]
MKKLFSLLAFVAVFVFLFQSCKKEESLKFDYNGEKITLTLKPNSNSPLSYDTANTVYFNADSMATANKFPREALKDITITDMEFNLLTSAPDQNFDLFETMNGSINTTQNPSPVSIFNTSKISSRTANKIVVSGINQNIKDQVFSNKYFKFDLEGALKDTLKKTITIEVKFTYAVSMLGVKLKK